MCVYNVVKFISHYTIGYIYIYIYIYISCGEVTNELDYDMYIYCHVISHWDDGSGITAILSFELTVQALREWPLGHEGKLGQPVCTQ